MRIWEYSLPGLVLGDTSWCAPPWSIWGSLNWAVACSQTLPCTTHWYSSIILCGGGGLNLVVHLYLFLPHHPSAFSLPSGSHWLLILVSRWVTGPTYDLGRRRLMYRLASTWPPRSNNYSTLPAPLALGSTSVELQKVCPHSLGWSGDVEGATCTAQSTRCVPFGWHCRGNPISCSDLSCGILFIMWLWNFLEGSLGGL